VTADVILAYLDALEAEALAQVRRKEAERDAELERTARARHELGAVPEVDLLQAELAASNAELAVLDAEGAARLARMRLLELIGFAPDPEVELLPPPEPGPIGDEAALRAVVFSESTVLAESEARLAAARWDARGRRLGFRPSVSLGFSWSRSEFGGTRDAFTLEPRNSQTAFRLSASWNALGQPLGLVGDRLRAEATEVAANAEHETARGALEREVIAGADRLERARILRDRIGVTLALAERQLAQAEERYRLGLAPLAERLTAETLWAEAARQEVAARYAPLRAVAQLERATGVAFWLAELR
jgi:outer membrane protein TolC